MVNADILAYFLAFLMGPRLIEKSIIDIMFNGIL